MSELSPKAKAMLALAREADAPLAGSAERIEGKLARRIATGAAVVGAGSALSQSASGAGLALLKTATAVGLGATATFAGYQIVSEATEVSPPKVQAVTRSVDSVNHATSVSPSQTAPSLKPTRPQTVQEEEDPHVSQEPLRTFTRPATPLAHPNPKPGKVTAAREEPLAPGLEPPRATLPPAPTPDRLEAETRAVREIQQALSAGDGARALQRLREMEARFTAGLLQQERAAARVQALCLVGQVAVARSEAAVFERLWPNSPLLGRVRNACQ